MNSSPFWEAFNQPEQLAKRVAVPISALESVDMSPYQKDPVGFARDVLGIKLWDQTAQTLKAIASWNGKGAPPHPARAILSGEALVSPVVGADGSPALAGASRSGPAENSSTLRSREDPAVRSWSGLFILDGPEIVHQKKTRAGEPGGLQGVEATGYPPAAR